MIAGNNILTTPWPAFATLNYIVYNTFINNVNMQFFAGVSNGLANRRHADLQSDGGLFIRHRCRLYHQLHVAGDFRPSAASTWATWPPPS